MPYRVLFLIKHLNLEHQECGYSRPAACVQKYKGHDSYRQEGALKTWVNPLLHKYHTSPLELFCNFRWKIIKLF